MVATVDLVLEFKEALVLDKGVFSSLYTINAFSISITMYLSVAEMIVIALLI